MAMMMIMAGYYLQHATALGAAYSILEVIPPSQARGSGFFGAHVSTLDDNYKVAPAPAPFPLTPLALCCLGQELSTCNFSKLFLI